MPTYKDFIPAGDDVGAQTSQGYVDFVATPTPRKTVEQPAAPVVAPTPAPAKAAPQPAAPEKGGK